MAPALSVMVSLALGATVSTSRLGVEVAGTGAGLSDLVAACPRALKVAQPFGGTTAHDVLSAYAAACSGGTPILELPDDNFAATLLTIDGGAADADRYWGFAVGAFGTGLTGPFAGLTAADVAGLRWISGPSNFFTAIANPNAAPELAQYAAGFVRRLATIVRDHAAANGGTYALLLPPWASPVPGAFCGVVDSARLSGAAIGWSFRTASTALAQATTDEAFGYRAVQSACGSTTSGLPLFVELTAAGGWFAGNRTATQLVGWLGFVDAEAAKDADVAASGAVLLRAVGGGGIDDLLPAVPALATYLAHPVPPGPPTPGTSPGGVDSGSPGASPVVPLGGSGGRTGCGLPAGGASLAALAAVAALALRRRR